MDLNLHDLRVLVTAGASGIGLATARAFAREGARVHICDVDRGALDALATQRSGVDEQPLRRRRSGGGRRACSTRPSARWAASTRW